MRSMRPALSRNKTRLRAAALLIVGAGIALGPGGDLAARVPGVISGVVVDSVKNDQVIAGAVVSVRGTADGVARSTVTDERGWFELPNVPAGKVRVFAAKPGYLESSYGATLPWRQGVELDLGADGRLTDLVLPIARGAVIGGTVRDQGGNALEAVKVLAYRLRGDGGAAGPPAATITDDRGVYRLFGLVPGEYIVAAVRNRETVDGSAVEVMSTQTVDATLKRIVERKDGAALPVAAADGRMGPMMVLLAPVFFPGTVEERHAGRVSTQSWEEHLGVDIVWQEYAAVSVEGTVEMGGFSPVPLSLTMRRVDDNLMLPSAQPSLQNRPTTDGRFKFVGVVSGRYEILAVTAAGGQLSASGVLWARREVVVASEDVTGVGMVLQPAGKVRGRIESEGRPLSRSDLTTVRITLNALSDQHNLSLNPVHLPTAVVDGSAAFQISNVVPGLYRLQVDGRGWHPVKAALGTADVLDVPFELSSTESGLTITLSDRLAAISGTLRWPSNITATSYFAVLYPQSEALRQHSRKQARFVRLNAEGGFILEGLPLGAYLLAIVTDVDSDDLQDLNFLKAIETSAVPVELNSVERKHIELRVTDPLALAKR